MNLKKAIIALITILLIAPSSYALNAVASIKALEGDVKVDRSHRTITAKKGLVLNDADIVITAHNAKTTILFRDGSEIRLFQNSRFVIEQSQEKKDGSRGFLNRFQLKIGSLWGKFAKNRQNTTIVTPTATCGIKGTLVAMSEGDGKLDIALSSGSVELENEDEKIMLNPGKMIKGIAKNGTFSDKIEDIPYRISIQPDQKKIKIPTKNNVEEVSFTVQLIDIRTKRNVERSATIYFIVDSDKIAFPGNIRLNQRGYRRVVAQIMPFQKSDYKNGQIEISAIAEGEKQLNIGAGKSILTYDMPSKSPRTIQINANTGSIN